MKFLKFYIKHYSDLHSRPAKITNSIGKRLFANNVTTVHYKLWRNSIEKTIKHCLWVKETYNKLVVILTQGLWPLVRVCNKYITIIIANK